VPTLVTVRGKLNHVTCRLCRLRRAKRPCPALGHDICPVCCGTKRIREIACPPTCVYLETAQKHPAAAVKRQQEHDLTVLMASLGRLSEAQLQLFFLMQTFIARFAPEGVSRVADADVADAAGALAAGLETASRGLVYEPPAASPTGEVLRRDLKALLDRVGRGGGSRFERDAADVLRGIERGARHETPGIGAGPVDYLTLVARVLQERPPDAPSRSPLILP
jgi:hypothetical protein